jgi:transposase-like protein
VPAPISMDLRLRSVCAVERGSSIRAAARRFAISPSAAIKLMQRVRATGSAAPARCGGHRRYFEAEPARARAPLEPAPTEPAGLAHPGFVLEPDLEPLGLGVVAGDLGDQRPELFLKRARALRSASGWIGRAFCQDRPRSWSRRSMPFSL